MRSKVKMDLFAKQKFALVLTIRFQRNLFKLLLPHDLFTLYDVETHYQSDLRVLWFPDDNSRTLNPKIMKLHR
ncbi:hypothetical protein DPMN_010871 [Dreissena polymorpha]|uniref:Uncharacterized protein n=1 Tax=Dreissena polymorpha TaxID=45954 RepID=A0A9D4S1E4_DREPO|nr:hypothetical protein DPMN_010871 [Dreissena polymorpha]